MSVSIKRSGDSEDGTREFPGVTSGKDYAVQGFSGGGVIIVNDDGKFMHVGFADVAADWTVTTEGAARKGDADKGDANRYQQAAFQSSQTADPNARSS